MIATPNRRHRGLLVMSDPTGNVATRYLSFGQSYSNCCKALLQSLQSNDYALACIDQWRWRGPCGLLASEPLKQDPGRFCQHDRDTLLRHLRGSPRRTVPGGPVVSHLIYFEFSREGHVQQLRTDKHFLRPRQTIRRSHRKS